MTEAYITPSRSGLQEEQLRCLDPYIVHKIDQALAKVGDFGEVVLVVSKGKVRFIQITQSESVRALE